VSEGAKLPVSQNALEALLDPKGQKGVQWRMQKLAAIRRLAKDGKTKAWLIWFLRTRTGLTLATARSLVEDAFLEEPKNETEEEPQVFDPDRISFMGQKGKKILKMRGFGETKMSKAPAGYVSRELRGEDVAAGKKHSTSSKSERTKP
jgi:hypothetical protein